MVEFDKPTQPDWPFGIYSYTILEWDDNMGLQLWALNPNAMVVLRKWAHQNNVEALMIYGDPLIKFKTKAEAMAFTITFNGFTTEQILNFDI